MKACIIMLAAAIKVESDPICSSAGCTQYKQKATPLGYDLDYFVPNFGPDPDMVGTAKAVSIAEAMHNHKLIMGTPQSRNKYKNLAKETLYDDKPDLDKDIIDSNTHLAAAESRLGHNWVIEEQEAYNPYYWLKK